MTEYKVVWTSETDFHGESSESLAFADALAYAKESAKNHPSLWLLGN